MKNLFKFFLALSIILASMDKVYPCSVMSGYRANTQAVLDLTPTTSDPCKEWNFGDLLTSKKMSFALEDISFDCINNNVQIIDKNFGVEKVILDYCQLKKDGAKLFAISIDSKRVVFRTNINKFISQLLMGLSFVFGTLAPPPPSSSLLPPPPPPPPTLPPPTLPPPTTSKSTAVPPPPPTTTSCGVPAITPNLSILSKIVGGTEAVPNSYPWQVEIYDGTYLCGGTLIDSQWVVTAAHCAQDMNLNRMVVTLGVHNINSTTEPNLDIKAIKAIINPGYQGAVNGYDNDIALIKLAQPVQFSATISPICLPPQGINYASVGTEAVVTGWGDTENNLAINRYKLRQVLTPIQDGSVCQGVTVNQLCAGDPYARIPHDSCQGDSGGPLAVKVGQYYTLVGVVSNGVGCGGRGIYTKVSNYVNWINQVRATN